MDYRDNADEDQVLLMIDNTKITHEAIIEVVYQQLANKNKRKSKQQRQDYLVSAVKRYITTKAGDDLKSVGNKVQAECLAKALDEYAGIPNYWANVTSYYVSICKEHHPDLTVLS